MKKLLLLLVVFTFSVILKAQVSGILNKAKQKIEEKANKKNTPKKEETPTQPSGTNTSNTTTQPAKPDSVAPANPAPVGIKAYSKYDFVPGEKVIGFEDFSTGNIGDFPTGWNTTSSAEIVTIEGKPGRWLMLTRPGVFVPEFTDKLPDDFTLEFDLLHGIPISGASFTVSLSELQEIDKPQNFTMGINNFALELDIATTGSTNGGSKYALRHNSNSAPANVMYTEKLNDVNNPAHISIWRQKERVRVYCNEEKFWDLPKGFAKEAKLNAIVFYMSYVDDKTMHYIGNLRLAVGAPDTRNKLLTQGKWTTHGILFDVNSANIKSESYGTLKEIANVLKENADLKVKIIGHTDSDGDDAKNMDLSKRRATAVKEALAKEFAIAEDRMQTDGLGESKPIDKNDSPAGKANNRRVEFVKI